MRAFILGMALAAAAAPMAGADTIRRACLTAERAGSPQLCSCIQAAADRTLSSSDQRLAAQFFRDPDMAQAIRQSDRQAHAVFWQRYKNFGATAEAYCS